MRQFWRVFQRKTTMAPKEAEKAPAEKKVSISDLNVALVEFFDTPGVGKELVFDGVTG